MRYYFLLVAIISTSCQISQRLHYCQEAVVVKDYSGLDGCKLLLQRSDQTLLLPVNLDSYDITAGDRLVISFQPTEGMSICMAEQKLVILTCVQHLSEVPCQPITVLEPGHWLTGKQQDLQPSKIIRYQYKDEYLYHFRSRSGDLWYDCRGRLVCDQAEICALKLSTLTDPLEVFVAHR